MGAVGGELVAASDELEPLTEICREELAALADARRAERHGGRIRVFGRLDALPAVLAETARRAQAGRRETTSDRVNVALGYSGRDELVDAMRGLIRSLIARGAARRVGRAGRRRRGRRHL